MTQLLLALDFGGTKHTAAVIARGERDWRTHRRVFSPPAPTCATISRLCSRWPANCWPGSARRPSASASRAGRRHHRHGAPLASRAGLGKRPLRAMLEAGFGAPCSVDNDANVAALGEHRFGAGRGCKDLLYITVSTGVGGGWVLNGQPWRGAEGMAGEIGHTVVDPNGPRCLCGKRAASNGWLRVRTSPNGRANGWPNSQAGARCCAAWSKMTPTR